MNATAEVTGMVTEVLVLNGETVADSQVLVVLESMKMEIPVAAPCAGVVGGLTVQVGDQVVAGQTLFSVDPGGN